MQSVKSKKKKKCSLEKGSVVEFIALVALGFKDAYLVDHIHIDINDVCILVDHSNSLCREQSHRTICKVLSVGMDIFVVATDSLQAKIAKLSCCDWSDFVALINVGTSTLELIESALLTDISQQLNCYLSSLPILGCSPICIDAIHPSIQLTTLPFLAGWLLGYCCLYRASNDALALSNTVLLKISVNFDKVRREVLSDSSPSQPIMEFTVPVSILDKSEEIKILLFEKIDHQCNLLNSQLVKIMTQQDLLSSASQPIFSVPLVATKDTKIVVSYDRLTYPTVIL